MAFGLSAASVGLLGVGANLVGGLMSDGAGGVQQEGANQASALQQEQYRQTRTDLAPYRDTGTLANNRLAHLLGLARDPNVSSKGMSFEDVYAMADADHRQKYGLGIDQIDPSVSQPWIDNMRAGTAGGSDPGAAGSQWGALLKKYTGQDLVNDPGYQFRASEGQKGVERSAAGRGGLFSGQAGKELERFRQGLASTEFGNAFNRDQAYKGQVYGMLSGTSGAGQNAANMTGTAGANAASQSGNYLTQGANAEAAGMVGVGNAINSGIGNYQNYNMLNSLFNKTQTGGVDSSYIPMQPGGGY